VTSRDPVATVDRDIPDASVTRIKPPRPNANAIDPTNVRRCRSSKPGRFCSISVYNAASEISTPKPYIARVITSPTLRALADTAVVLAPDEAVHAKEFRQGPQPGDERQQDEGGGQ
jgi:hypothetical protein